MPGKFINVVSPAFTPTISKVNDSEFSVGFDMQTLEVPSDIQLYREYKPMMDVNVYYITFSLGGSKHYSPELNVTKESLLMHSEEMVADEIFNHILKWTQGTFDWHDQVRIVFRSDLLLALDMGSTVLPPISFVFEGAIKNTSNIANISKTLPGVQQVVGYPCDCEEYDSCHKLWDIIQHLNDVHTDWTRERIADWIDELHDAGDINAEFQPWNSEPVEDETEFVHDEELFNKLKASLEDLKISDDVLNTMMGGQNDKD